jgi:FixJ family two-component response regulator
VSAPVVLLVDDDESMCRAIVRILEAGGMRPIAFHSAEALLAAGPPPADAVVIDVHLPGMDGFALYERLRAARGGYPAVFVSALEETGERVRALAGPPSAFLAKPFSGQALLELLQRVMARAA